MSSSCEHEKEKIVVDKRDGSSEIQEFCPICDDVQVETLDDE